MLKKIMSFLLVGLCLFPIITKGATEYKTLNLKGALEEENAYLEKNGVEKININLGDYKESSEKVNVYLFRGLGCGYCRGFLTYLNNNIGELGKYMNLVSYEVWNDKTNASLLKEVGNFTGEAANGVPYIIVGEQVFAGFTEEAYGEEFKAAVKAEYEKKDRYDVFKEMEKAKKNAEKANGADTNKVVIWNGVFTLVTIGAVGIMFYNTNKKIDELKKTPKQVVIKEKETEKEETKSTSKKKKKK